MQDDDRQLDEGITGLAREAQPGRDLWPALRGSLPPRQRAPRGRHWLQIAAAIALFGAGLLAGRNLEGRPAQVERSAIGDLAAAVEVQRAGAAYVRALADLRTGKDALPAAVVMQGRGAAIATMEGAAWELKQFSPADDTAAGIFALASRDREER
ncbi:MAG: hypothetical protein M3Q55_02825 [Acidobacteriota bacterium]|nr:hypothetical protein [Acidobacteriota bacterium]